MSIPGYDVSAAAKKRVIYEFDIPADVLEELGTDNEVKSFGLVEVTTGEEMRAAKKAGTNTAAIGSELLKISLVQVNGADLDKVSGGMEVAWAGFKPRIRQFMVAAYMNVHTSDEEVVKDFLKGRKVKV